MKMNNKGAASILVILIVVVLATFGGIAITAGWTNKQLSIKAAQSKADYYALDSVAEEAVADIDYVVYLSQTTAYEYLNAVALEDDTESLKAEAKLAPLFNNDIEIVSPALRVRKINEAFTRIYFYECASNLERYAASNNMTLEYAQEYAAPEDFLDINKKIPSEGDLKIAFTVSEGEKSGSKNLDIEIALKVPDIAVSFLNEDEWKTKFEIAGIEDTQRYSVLSWKLWQSPIDYEQDNPKYG